MWKSESSDGRDPAFSWNCLNWLLFPHVRHSQTPLIKKLSDPPHPLSSSDKICQQPQTQNWNTCNLLFSSSSDWVHPCHLKEIWFCILVDDKLCQIDGYWVGWLLLSLLKRHNFLLPLSLYLCLCVYLSNDRQCPPLSNDDKLCQMDGYRVALALKRRRCCPFNSALTCSGGWFECLYNPTTNTFSQKKMPSAKKQTIHCWSKRYTFRFAMDGYPLCVLSIYKMINYYICKKTGDKNAFH